MALAESTGIGCAIFIQFCAITWELRSANPITTARVDSANVIITTIGKSDS